MDMDGRGVWSRRRIIAGSPLIAVGTAGCMRFATSSTAPLEVTIDDVDVPTDLHLHQDVSLGSRLVNDSSYAGEVTVVVALDDRTLARESVHLEPESETTLETGFTPTEAGEHELHVRVEGDSEDPIDRRSETLVVTGRRLTFEWADTFVPADNAATASDTRNLAFACFLVQFRRDGTVIEEYDVGTEADVDFVSGVFDVDEDLIGDERLEELDGEQGRWLGTEDERTDLVVPDAELLERADTLQLYGYSLLEAESTVRVRVGETPIDTATVPARDEGESVLEVDLSDDDTAS